MSDKYRHLYLIIQIPHPEVFKKPPKPGDLLLWTWHGWYYTLKVLDHDTMEIIPAANIVFLKKLDDAEDKCINDDGKPLTMCLDKKELMVLIEKRLEQAKKYFGVTDDEINKLISYVRKALLGKEAESHA